MGIGKIASLFSSLNPAADQAPAVVADEATPDFERRTQAAAEQSSLNDQNRNGDPINIAAQLQTMINAVRTLNENAIQQGAAVAVSAAGTELRNAVTALGHLLAAVDTRSLANGADTQLRQAGKLMDSVETALMGSQAAAETIMRNLPAVQAQQAQMMSDRFQMQMRNAVQQVRNVLTDLNVRA